MTPKSRTSISPPEVAQQINGWASKETHGKIPKVIDRIDPRTLLLVNAVYFKGRMDSQIRQGEDATARLHPRRRFEEASAAHGTIGSLRIFPDAADAGDPPALWRRGLVMEILLPAKSSSLGALEATADARALEGVANPLRAALRNN